MSAQETDRHRRRTALADMIGGSGQEGVRLEDQGVSGSRASLSPALVRGGGGALAAGGMLFAVATVLHPSQETPALILETEARLVGSHAVYIVAYLLILLGLAALFGAAGQRLGRLGVVGFLVTFAGTALLAVSSQFGFLAPVLAAEAPAALDAIIVYPPVVVFNGFAGVGFMAGYAILGMAIASASVFPRWPGILIAVGAPTHLVGFGVAQLGRPALWFVAVLGSVALGLGLASCGYRMWTAPEL